MSGFKSNLLGRKTKSDSNQINSETQHISSTKINSSTFSSPPLLPYRYNPYEEYGSSIFNNYDLLNSPTYKNDNSINDNENDYWDQFKSDESLNEDKENSIYEIFECINILTKLRTIFIRIDIIKKKEEYQIIREQWVL